MFTTAHPAAGYFSINLLLFYRYILLSCKPEVNYLYIKS